MTEIFLNDENILNYSVILPKMKWIKIAKRHTLQLESYPGRVIFIGKIENTDALK